MSKLVLASNNAGKIKEIQKIVETLGLEVMPQKAFDIPEAEENGLSFVENAILKARNACLHSGLPAIADDSGLEVDFLNGQPGIYSARYAGIDADDEQNLQKLLATMERASDEQRQARFQCVMVYIRHAEDPTPVIAQGTWEGTISRQKSGQNGFGYDPIFWLADRHCSSADLDSSSKNQISHRGQALRKLAKMLKDRAI